MLNKIILIGRMTKDPEQRGKDPEKPIAYFRIAVDRDFKRDGEPEADFFDCSVFGQQAKFVLQYGRKGRLVCVVGAMQHREWQDQQTGEKRTAFEVVRVDVHFLDKKPDDVQTSNMAQPTATAGYAAPQGAAPATPRLHGARTAACHAAGRTGDRHAGTVCRWLSAACTGCGSAVCGTRFQWRTGKLCVGAGRDADCQHAVLRETYG